MVQISVDGTDALFTIRLTTWDALISLLYKHTRTNKILPLSYFNINTKQYVRLENGNTEPLQRKTHVKLRLGDQEGIPYEGDLNDFGEKHGFGTYRWPNGRVYIGQWISNEMCGEGTESWPNGSKYHGEFRANKRNGHGNFTWSDGSQYVGEYWNDLRHGYGVFTSGDGYKYEGQWRMGKKHGRGLEIFSNGHRYNGFFENDKPVN